MTVYVDNYNAPFGRMIMCHMVADTLDELHAMADKIGVARKWFQDHRTPHYDICKSKQELAFKHGALPVTARELVKIVRGKR